jgi:hypothetical protein
MYKISQWASVHAWPARILISCAFVLITALGLFTGDLLQAFQLTIPLLFFYAAVVLFLAVFLIYPGKTLRHRFRNVYWYRKTCDCILLLTTFFFLICIGNRPAHLLQPVQPVAAAVPHDTATIINPGAGKEKTSILPLHKKASKRALKQTLIKKIKQLRKAYKDTPKGEKIAFIILSVIIALALLYVVAALSCSIACSGADGLALLVLVLGAGIIVFFLVRVIRRITKGPRQKRERAPSVT